MIRRATLLAAVAGVALATLSLASAAGGDLDPGFGDGGIVVAAPGSPALATAVAVQRDGKVVVAAWSRSRGVLIRFLPDGALDPGFGNGGVADTVGGATGIALQADGRIVVAGTIEGDFALRRHRPDGSLDAGFGDAGTVTTDLGGSELLWSVLLQPDRRIVAIGSSAAQGNSRFALARYLPDGRLDPGFGSGGRVVAVEGGWKSVGALAPGGMIVVASSRVDAEGHAERLVVARFTARGALDRSFSGDGVATLRPAYRGAPFPSAVAVQPDGKVVVANVEVQSSVLGLVRLGADGALDRAFGYGSPARDDRIYGYRALAVDPRGRIVVAGHGPDLFENVLVARVTPAGRLDPRFGQGGVVTTAFGGRAEASALALQPDGKVVVAGWTGAWIGADDTKIALARYRATTCAVPDVTGQTLAAARRMLRQRGCAPGAARRTFSARVPAGRVIGQRPAPGRQVADHVPVSLVVSSGPRP